MHESAEYELHKLSNRNPKLLHEVAATRAVELSEKILKLEAEAEELKKEIEDLKGGRRKRHRLIE